MQARFTIQRYDVEKCLAIVEERQAIDLADPRLDEWGAPTSRRKSATLRSASAPRPAAEADRVIAEAQVVGWSRPIAERD